MFSLTSLYSRATADSWKARGDDAWSSSSLANVVSSVRLADRAEVFLISSGSCSGHPSALHTFSLMIPRIAPGVAARQGREWTKGRTKTKSTKSSSNSRHADDERSPRVESALARLLSPSFSLFLATLRTILLRPPSANVRRLPRVFLDVVVSRVRVCPAALVKSRSSGASRSGSQPYTRALLRISLSFPARKLNNESSTIRNYYSPQNRYIVLSQNFLIDTCRRAHVMDHVDECMEMEMEIYHSNKRPIVEMYNNM